MIALKLLFPAMTGAVGGYPGMRRVRGNRVPRS
jgi:hypothetical protein